MSFCRSQRVRLLPRSHQVYKYELVHPHPNDHVTRRTSLASAGRQIHAYADIYTRRRKQSVAHKSGRQLFEMDVRGIKTSLQDDAEDGYNLDGGHILNYGKEFD